MTIAVLALTTLLATGAGRDWILEIARLAFVPQSLTSWTRLGARDSPITVEHPGPLGDGFVDIRLRFRADETIGYPNILQTAAGNSGARVEINRGVVALVVPDPTSAGGATAMVLTAKLRKGEWYSLRLFAAPGIVLRAELSGSAPVVRRGERASFSVNDIRIGTGFGGARRFKGEISDVSADVGLARSRTFGRIWYVPLLLLAGACAVAAIINLFRGGIPRNRTLLLARRIPRAAARYVRFASVAAIVLLLLGSAYWLLAHQIRYDASAAIAELLPGFQDRGGSRLYKGELVAFALMELGAIVLILMFWFARSAPSVLERFPRLSALALCLALISAGMAVVSPHPFSRAMFVLAFGAALAAIRWRGWLPRLAPQPSPERAVRPVRSLRGLLWLVAKLIDPFAVALNEIASAANACARRASEFSQRAGARLARTPRASRALEVAAWLAAAVTVILTVAPWGASSYPIRFPNDYYELADSVQLEISDRRSLERTEFLRCLRSLVGGEPADHAKPGYRPPSHPSCAPLLDLTDDRMAALVDAAASSSGWESEPGRALFHHAYILIPARHFLTYGFDRAVPYLYGYGNTLFHAALMSAFGGASLTSYFETLPLAEFLGLLAIVVLVAYGTRSLLAAATAFALGLSAFYSISFLAVLLSAGFSPLRYLGLVVQLASVIFLFRGSAARRYLAVPAAAGISFFWNTEYAVIGSVAQVLALLSPNLGLALFRRVAALALCAAPAVLFFFGATASPDIIVSIQLGLFNVAVPVMTLPEAIEFLLLALGAQVVLTTLAWRFPRQERDARLCILATLAITLVKYVYNPSPPHLSFVLILLAPAVLLYFSWNGRSGKDPRVVGVLRGSACLAALAVCLWAGAAFLEGAAAFHRGLTDEFVMHRWTKLGERMPVATPQEPIADRVKAIQAVMRPGDKLLVLSPFDHLLSYYVNPREFCGHFELLSNVATQRSADTVVRCALESPSVLVVYDAALEKPCPDLLRESLALETNCPKKRIMKENLVSIMTRLKDDTVSAGSSGDLSFYRVRNREERQDGF